MYQAGVKNITLYENKDITFYFYDPLNLNAITDINSGGEVVIIENNQQPEIEIKTEMSKSGYVVNDYKIKFYILGVNVQNASITEQLMSSVYGWCALVEYYDGTAKLYNVPMFAPDSEIKPHEEMTIELSLETRVPTKERFYEYTAGISTVPIYRADTTILTADTTIYTADYAL